MILDLEDKNDSLLRKIKIELVKQAADKFDKNRRLMSAYIGISTRTLRKWINNYEELKEFRIKSMSNNSYWDDSDSWHRKLQ
jgi:hypothetical protein